MPGRAVAERDRVATLKYGARPRGRAAEPVYRPLLAGRRGELDALAHLDEALAPLLAPVIDVHAVDPCTVDLLGRLPAGLLPAVDVSALPDSPESELVRWGYRWCR